MGVANDRNVLPVRKHGGRDFNNRRHRGVSAVQLHRLPSSRRTTQTAAQIHLQSVLAWSSNAQCG
jgi:hypothetical protein